MKPSPPYLFAFPFFRIYFPELDYSDILQITEVPNHNMQPNSMETTKQPIGYTEEVEYAYDYGHNEYSTEHNVYTNKGTWNKGLPEQGMFVGVVSMTSYIYLLIHNSSLPCQNLGMD